MAAAGLGQAGVGERHRPSMPARRVTARLAREVPGRRLHVSAGSAYAGEELNQLPDGVTWTTRLRRTAALHGLPPERTGKR